MDEIGLIRECLEQVHETSFDLRCAHPCTFGEGHQVSVIQLPLHGALKALKLSIDNKLREVLARERNPLETRAYAPHLTLARVKQVNDFEALAICLADAPEPPAPFSVDHFELIQSQLL